MTIYFVVHCLHIAKFKNFLTLVKPGLYSFLIGWRWVFLLETWQQRLYWEEVRKLATGDGFRGWVAEILDWLYTYKNSLSCSCTWPLAVAKGGGGKWGWRSRWELSRKVGLELWREGSLGLCAISSLLLCSSASATNFSLIGQDNLFSMIIRNVSKPSDHSLCPQP